MKKAIIGAGGHAREVMAQIGAALTCFVDDQYVSNDTKPLSEFDPSEYEVMVAVADSRDRYEIVKRLPSGTKFFSFIHPTALLMKNDIEIGQGSFIGAYSILTTNIRIGNHAILNRANQIGHDCLIGDYFSAMPGSILSGNVTVRDCVYIGNNSSIKEKISVSNDVIIGMNSGVIKNIDEPGVYVGTPARKI
jgi:sugar O-acyltransferase (sialic acid O-acetyltransferase NeuD family)